MNDVTGNALASSVVGGTSAGGVTDGKARKFDGEASDRARRRGGTKESWEKGVGNGLLNIGEGVRGALEDTLDKLPLHLEGFC